MKSKSPCILLKKNINFIKNETELKMENPTHSLRDANLVLQLIQESQIKSRTVMSWSSQKKIEDFFVSLVWSEGTFLKICVLFQCICIEYTFRIYILLQIKKRYFIHFCCLFLKSSKVLSVFLKGILNLFLCDS